MKIVAIVQARMGSTRLPGKVLKKVMGKPLLEYQTERMQRSALIDQLVISTTSKLMDDPINDWCKKLSLASFRGSESDVLERFYQTSTFYKADVIVRMTADCPLIDPAVIDRVIQLYLDHYPHYPYVSNIKKRTYPRGIDTEVFSHQALKHAHEIADEDYHREHVTPLIAGECRGLRDNHVMYRTDESHHRWTVDTKEDFLLVSKILKTLYPINPTFTLEDILSLMSARPEWMKINEHIRQKDR